VFALSKPHVFISVAHLLAAAGLATATTSATFLPQCERRIRCASAASVTERPAIRASASGSMWRDAPHGQVTRTALRIS
jgi:hypothetical protein